MSSNVTDTSGINSSGGRRSQTIDNLDSSSFDGIEMFFVAGVPDSRKNMIKGMKATERFVGCLKNVVFKASANDESNRDVFDFSGWTQAMITGEQARLKSRVRQDFKLQSSCKGSSCTSRDLLPNTTCNLNIDDKLSFITPQSFVKIDPARIVDSSRKQPKQTESWSIRFDFRTRELDGLLLTTASAYKSLDMFAIELYNGQIYPIIKKDGRNIAKGPVEISSPIGVGALNNGEWHKLAFSIDRIGAKLTVDNNEMPITDMPPKMDPTKFGEFYIGGIDATRFDTSLTPFPVEFRTAISQLGFTGCIRDVQINGKPVSIVNWAQRALGTEVGCCEKGAQCNSDVCKGGQNDCQNDSQCIPSVYSRSGYTCRCKEEAADWYGRNCQVKAIYEGFGTVQKPVTVNFANTLRSGHDVFSFRFRMTRGRTEQGTMGYTFKTQYHSNALLLLFCSQKVLFSF